MQFGGRNALIIGGTGGLGTAWVSWCLNQTDCRQVLVTTRGGEPLAGAGRSPRVRSLALDLCDPAAISMLGQEVDDLALVLYCAGYLHDADHGPEKSLSQVDSEYYFRSMQINALAPLLVAQAVRPALQGDAVAHFAAISAKVGSIEDNRLGGWYSYRCSKAALNMGLKNLAIEWRRTLPSVVVSALHPGTVRTRLSEPFSGGRPHPERFAPEQSVDLMGAVLSSLSPEASGGFWNWDGVRLPW